MIAGIRQDKNKTSLGCHVTPFGTHVFDGINDQGVFFSENAQRKKKRHKHSIHHHRVVVCFFKIILFAVKRVGPEIHGGARSCKQDERIEPVDNARRHQTCLSSTSTTQTSSLSQTLSLMIIIIWYENKPRHGRYITTKKGTKCF